MKRFISTIFVIILCFLLQTTVFHEIALANVVPNLLIIITVAVGYMRGHKEGLFVGIMCGLLVDFVYGDVIGLYALIYMSVGYLNGFCNKIYYRDDFTIPIILVGISDFYYNFFYYIFNFLLRNRLNFFFYLRRIILPELVYTVLVSVVLYKLLHMLNALLEHSETKEE
jgi:rod shape-determining protein MreD